MALETMIVGHVPPVVTERDRAAAQQILTRFRRRKIVEMREELADLTTALSAADVQIAELTAVKAERAQQEAELREVQVAIVAVDEEITDLRASNASMRTALAEARTREINARVDVALATWRDKRDLTESSRTMLTHLCGERPELFEHEFPQIEPEHQHLLRNFTARGARDPRGGSLPPELPTMSLQDIANAIAREHGITMAEALHRAEKLVNGGARS